MKFKDVKGNALVTLVKGIKPWLMSSGKELFWKQVGDAQNNREKVTLENRCVEHEKN